MGHSALIRAPLAVELHQPPKPHDSTVGRIDSLDTFTSSALSQERGIIVLTLHSHILFMNPTAHSLTSTLMQETEGVKARGILPQSLRLLLQDLAAQVHRLSTAKGWECVERTKLLGPAHFPLLVKGIGIPDIQHEQQARMILILEDLSSRETTSLARASGHYAFTEREHTVVQELMKGQTNKEIGNSLGIAEQTVKEHIKRIMIKTGTTTRTGLLAKVFQC